MINLKPSEYIKDLEPIYKYRVIDGFGYHEGRFKRRQAVRSQQIPQDFDEMNTRAFNQGLGRSFWYTAQGEPEKLSKLIAIFPEERHYDMWRGVGVAVAYVGGIEESILNQLSHYSENNQNPFKCGIALAIHTREEANTTAKNTKQICKFILKKSTSEVSQILKQLEKETPSTPELFYFDWINRIEQQL